MAELQQMYVGLANSPQTTLTRKIGPTDTIIDITNVNYLPDGPNIAVIGTDEEAETIIYAAKTATALSGCQRGVEGTAKEWEVDSIISRNFTNLDYQTLIDNIVELDKNKAEKTEIKTKLSELTDDETHRLVTDTEKTVWNKVSDKADITSVAKLEQSKAEKTEIKTKLSELTDDETHRLVTDTEKEKWDNKLDSTILTSDINEASETKAITQKGANNLRKLIDNNSQDILTKLGATDILQTIEGTATNKTVSQNAIKTVVDSINQKLTQGGGNYTLGYSNVSYSARSDAYIIYLLKNDVPDKSHWIMIMKACQYWMDSQIVTSSFSSYNTTGTSRCHFGHSNGYALCGFDAGSTRLSFSTGLAFNVPPTNNSTDKIWHTLIFIH